MSQAASATLTEEAERLLQGRTRDIWLSASLYTAFRDRSFKQTSKIIRSWMSWAALLNLVSLATNFVLLPHDTAHAMVLPSLLVLPAALLAYVAWGKRRPYATLDLSLLASLILILLAVGLTGLAAGEEFQERYLSVMLFVAVSAIIIFNVPIQITVIVALAGLSLYLELQLFNPAISFQSTLSGFLFFASGIAAMVVARRTISVLATRSFLLELRDARRAEDLTAINLKLDRLAKTDALTGLSNRRHMEETLATLSANTTQSPKPIAMLMCDIDYFKRLNDLLGHAEGDRCLIEVGQAIANCVDPDTDHVARFGGEEFLVVLAGHNADHAMTVAENIRATIAALDLPNPGSPINGKVTISIGVAIAPLDTPARPAWLLLKSDGALYGAKRQGRNCAVEHQDAAPANLPANSMAS